MITNYTLHDILATAATVPVFAIFLFAPGYVFGWATNLLRFRSRTTAERILLSLPLSIVVSTVLANIVGRFVPRTAILWIFLALAAAACVHGAIRWLRTRKARGMSRMHRLTWFALLLAIVWAAVAIATLVDLQFGHRLYASSVLYDHAVRIAFLHSAMRSGPPPANPFFDVGHAPIARYYYYWYVLCSYPARLTGIGARYILYGSSMWTGFALASLIPIYLSDFFGVRERLRRKTIIGILLLAVTGFDLIPTIYEYLRAGMIFPDMEGWDPVQVTAWSDALLWVPHHVAALIACFIGFLALWSIRAGDDDRVPGSVARWTATTFAALAFAASAGLSVYVTFTFAIFLVAWALRLLFKRRLRDFAGYVIAGIITVAISLPYLHDLLHSPSVMSAPANASAAAKAAGAGGGFIAFGLRQLPNFASTPHFLQVRGFSHPHLFAPFGVIVVYILEFGLFAFIAWERVRDDWRRRTALKEAEIAAWWMIAIGMFVITFLRSSVISNNDLAFRSAMIVQFILLLWAALYLDDRLASGEWSRSNWKRTKNLVVTAALALGFLSTLYGLVNLRIYSILDEKGLIANAVGWLPPSPHIGTGLFDIRQAYTHLDAMLPPNSAVQYNPMADDYLSLLQYDKFPTVDGMPNCGADFGGSLGECLPAQKQIAAVFNDPETNALEGDNLRAVCRRWSIDVLVAQKGDPVWRDPKSWVWTQQPIVANGYIRAFRCR